MLSRRQLATILVTVASSKAGWNYKQLTDIQILEAPHGRYARLICEHDCGGAMFTVHCSERNFVYLEPYAQWLSDNREDPYGVEKPVIPVFFSKSGHAFLSVNGARVDHPQLPRARQSIDLRGSVGKLCNPQPAANSLHWLQNLFRS